MRQSDDKEIESLQKIQRLRSEWEQRMADYAKLMKGFANGGDDVAREHAQQLLREMKKIDDQIADLLKR